jgi:WD40-like Beta Propeller Repeat
MRAVPARRYAGAVLAALIAAAGLSACGGGANPAPTVTVTQSAGPSSRASATTPPAMVAVTTAGALVTLNPATGAVQQTLVPSGVIGDEISVSPGGQVYFAVQNGCTTTIEEVPVSGGPTAQITAGSLPAISPDGTKLAYADEPVLSAACPLSTSSFLPLYHLAVRTLSSGTTQSLSMLPASQYSGLPIPISHLSWAPDNQHVAVSIAAVQDNEGWGVYLVDTAHAQYYLTGASTAPLPVTGQPTPQQSYLREGVYMPNGNLFVSRACCGGDPVQNTSRLMWEVNTSGVLVHQVALGFASLDHTSLDVSPDGNWLLYLAGNDLYVSRGGATPAELTSGLIAAAWG